jgi:hypothetical protein
MTTSTSYQRNRQSGGPAAYLGWSHANNRMEMMDLPGYLDSLQRSYDSAQQAYESMLGAMPGAAAWGSPWGSAPTPAPGPTGWQGRPGRAGKHGRPDRDCGCGGHHHDHDHDHHDHDHGHHHDHDHDHHGHHHDRDCGCGAVDSCRCECCVEDADIVVYAHCGEIRVVPIEVENDTRKARDDVSLEISEVRTAGGRVLPWPTASSAKGPLTLDACSTTRFDVRIRIDCPATDPASGQDDGKQPDDQPADQPQDAEAGSADELRAFTRTRGTDLDECVVGYFTVRLGGCVTRPIVVAVAALPLSCDSYRTGCACTCCC